eukprot:801115-Pleurochrysis_carterae.AAC.1
MAMALEICTRHCVICPRLSRRTIAMTPITSAETITVANTIARPVDGGRAHTSWLERVQMRRQSRNKLKRRRDGISRERPRLFRKARNQQRLT